MTDDFNYCRAVALSLMLLLFAAPVVFWFAQSGTASYLRGRARRVAEMERQLALAAGRVDEYRHTVEELTRDNARLRRLAGLSYPDGAA